MRHLHLADDQGWRIEITSWPNLTAIGGQTVIGGARGEFYTQEQYADIVAYARSWLHGRARDRHARAHQRYLDMKYDSATVLGRVPGISWSW